MRTRRDRGASLVEYALLLAFIALLAALAVRSVGPPVSGRFSQVSSVLNT